MNLFKAAAMVKQLASGKNPQELFNQMLRTNPQFAQFVERYKGKNVEEIAQEAGIDLDTFRSFFN